MDITQADWDAVAQEREAPASPETPPQIVEPDPTPAPVEEEQRPKYAELDPEVQEKLKRLDELTAALPQLAEQLRKTTGRVGALQSQWDKSRQSTQAPTQTQVAAAAKDPEKWESLKKDFPEWGEAISEFVETKLGALQQAPSGPKAEEIEQLIAQRTEAATEGLQKKLNEALVTVAHRGWKEEVKTPQFAAWYQSQAADVQALAGSPTAEDAIRMLDLYAASKAKPAEKVAESRSQRLAAAVTTTKPGGSAPVTPKKFEDMTAKEQWDYIAREREKQAAG